MSPAACRSATQKSRSGPAWHAHRGCPDVLALAGHMQPWPCRLLLWKDQVWAAPEACKCQNAEDGRDHWCQVPMQKALCTTQLSWAVCTPDAGTMPLHAFGWLSGKECMKMKQITGYYKKHISLIGFWGQHFIGQQLSMGKVWHLFNIGTLF